MEVVVKRLSENPHIIPELREEHKAFRRTKGDNESVSWEDYKSMVFTRGAIMINIDREEPVASLDSSGKIIWAKNTEIQTVNIKEVGGYFEVTDSERLHLAVKELGSCDLYPQSLKKNPNGRFVVVCGDGEYIIYTALAWRNRSFGSALEFVWASDGEYAIRESTSKIKIFSKTFQERKR
jgi:coatomer subunit beta'